MFRCQTFKTWLKMNLFVLNSLEPNIPAPLAAGTDSQKWFKRFQPIPLYLVISSKKTGKTVLQVSWLLLPSDSNRRAPGHEDLLKRVFFSFFGQLKRTKKSSQLQELFLCNDTKEAMTTLQRGGAGAAANLESVPTAPPNTTTRPPMSGQGCPHHYPSAWEIYYHSFDRLRPKQYNKVSTRCNLRLLKVSWFRQQVEFISLHCHSISLVYMHVYVYIPPTHFSS